MCSTKVLLFRITWNTANPMCSFYEGKPKHTLAPLSPGHVSIYVGFGSGHAVGGGGGLAASHCTDASAGFLFFVD